MNIIDNIKKTESFWNLPKKTIFHIAINLVIYLKISFKQGRKIRQELYKKINSFDLSKELLCKLTNQDFARIGLEDNKISVINKIIDAEDLSINYLEQLKGIGPWTIKSLKIMNGEKNLFLEEDYWIRKRLKELFNLDKVPTIKESKKIVEHINCDKSELTRFLWRIKPNGIVKVKNNEELVREDFL